MLNRAKTDATTYLARRTRSEVEMVRYLQEKGYQGDLIDAVISWLYELEYLDDLAFAEAYIRDKLRFHPCGSKQIRIELDGRGINEDNIRKALMKNYPRSLELRMAQMLAKKKMKVSKSKNQIKRYLYQKGFEPDIISEIDEMMFQSLDSKEHNL